MIMKNGAPIQTLTRITENRAQYASPVHATGPTANLSSTQLKALYEGSNSHNQARQLMAGGITHRTSSKPRHLRCPLLGALCTRRATMKPTKPLKNTPGRAEMQGCSTTIHNDS